MRKYLYTLILFVSSFGASAQSYQNMQIGLLKGSDSYYLSYPSTSISVELLVEEEVITPGLYARYAQKYLSMRAPLITQTNYRIVDATINKLESVGVRQLEVASPIVEYSALPVDQYSSEVLAVETAARDAAAAIFTIRRQRRDIINGEAGEGYFGAGLKDAMDYLDRMEEEYIELFMGKRTVTQSVRNYTFSPSEDLQRFVIARFDAKSGILPSTDLMGVPVYIQFNALPLPDTTDIEAIKTSPNNINIRIAAQTQCTLYNDSKVLTTTILPIYEFGETIEIRAPKR